MARNDTKPFFLYGLVPVSETMNSENICMNGRLIRMDTRFDAVDAFIFLTSIGLSSAYSVNYVCIQEEKTSKPAEPKQNIAKPAKKM